jgi:hypothetical protein
MLISELTSQALPTADKSKPSETIMQDSSFQHHNKKIRISLPDITHSAEHIIINTKRNYEDLNPNGLGIQTMVHK